MKGSVREALPLAATVAALLVLRVIRTPIVSVFAVLGAMLVGASASVAYVIGARSWARTKGHEPPSALRLLLWLPFAILLGILAMSTGIGLVIAILAAVAGMLAIDTVLPAAAG
jgi:hypothetical protein